MIDVAITDDHQLVIDGLRTMLKPAKDLRVSQCFATLGDTFQGLDKSTNVLLLDINLPDGNGIHACRLLLEKFPSLCIIALTNLEEIAVIKQMIKQGAKGYLLKNTDRHELVEAIHAVVAGETFLPPRVQQLLIQDSLGKTPPSSHLVPKLSMREKEVLSLIIREFTTEEIAKQLFLSTKTVETHRSNLLQKLQVKNSAGLVRMAYEWNLVQA